MIENLFIPAPFFFLRIPLWSLEDYENLILKENWEEEVLRLYENNPFLREAIAIASPSLSRSLQKKPLKNRSQSAMSLFHYLIRLSSRATPFGLFSSVATGNLKNHTQITYENGYALKKRARPDMEWVYAYINKLYADPDRFQELTVRFNPLAYQKGDRFFLNYVRSSSGEKKNISFRATKLIQSIALISKTKIQIGHLLQELQELIPNVEAQKVVPIIKELLSQQLLLPGQFPSLLNPSFFSNFFNHFQDLHSIANQLDRYHATALGEGEKILEEIQNEMSRHLETKSYLQVDTIDENQGLTLSTCVTTEISQSLSLLWNIFSPQLANPKLKTYHEKFLERYGVFRTVPLLELLSEEKGLGSLENMPPKTSTSPFQQQWEEWISKQWQEALHKNSKTIEITEETLSHFLTPAKTTTSTDPHEATPSFDVFFKVLAQNSKEIDEGNFQVYLSQITSQGGSSIGRFLDCSPSLIQEQLKAFLQEEENLEQNAIFVELSHMPAQIRSANVAIQPCLRKYRCDLEESGQTLNLNDIYVGALQDRLYLTLQDGKVEIIARVGNLLNLAIAPIPLQFMREVSMAKYKRLSAFSYGSIEQHAIYLPRVCFQKTILFPATWNLRNQTFKKDSMASVIAQFTLWAKQWNLPDRFYLKHLDNILLYDLKHPAHLQEIGSKILKGESLQLQESFDDAWIPSIRGHHTGEFICPFLKHPTYKNKHPISPPPYQPHSLQTRWKLPGSQWFYIKIYLSEDSINRFLVSNLTSIVESFREKQLISEWFFVRYRDPDSHLRLRLHLREPHHLVEVLACLENASQVWLDNHLIKNTLIASYEREIERYGGIELIESVESLFCADSLFCAYLLTILNNKQIKCHELVLFSLSVINFLRNFGLDINRSILFLQNEDRSELQGFREHKSILVRLATSLINNRQDAPEIETILEANSFMQPTISRFLADSPLATVPLYTIYNSLLHMHCNRLGCNQQVEKKIRLYALATLLQISQKESFERAELSIK